MILGMHHVGLATPDLDTLCSFYTELFDGRIINEFSWDETERGISIRLGLEKSSGRLVMLNFKTANIELFQFSTPIIQLGDKIRSVAKPGLSHICFNVDNCQYEYDRLVEKGMTFNAPPMTMPRGGVFTYGRDPDGNIVELLQVPITT